MGASFQPLEFSYELNNTEYKYGESTYSKFITPIYVGLTYASKSLLYNVCLRYTRKISFDYYQSPGQTSASQYSGLNVNFSLFKSFDTSKSLASDHQVDQSNKKQLILKKENGLSIWYWALESSSALEMAKSSHFKKNQPFLNSTENGTRVNQTKPIVGLVFGWDIRVSTGSSLLLTNLKWAPNNHLKMKDSKVMFDHLEFNFIQYVHFIGSNSIYRKYTTTNKYESSIITHSHHLRIYSTPKW